MVKTKRALFAAVTNFSIMKMSRFYKHIVNLGTVVFTFGGSFSVAQKALAEQAERKLLIYQVAKCDLYQLFSH